MQKLVIQIYFFLSIGNSTDILNTSPLAGEANYFKSQSQQEEMWLEAQVNLYNM